MIREGSHGFVKLLPLHGLNGRHDLGAAKPKRGGGSGGNNRYPHPLRGSLESVEVVSRLPLFRHATIYTFKVYGQADNLKISTVWLARLCPFFLPEHVLCSEPEKPFFVPSPDFR